MERNNKPTKNLFLMKFTGVLIQIVLIVISVVLTFLMTQLYYDRNVRYQVKVDASKELFLRQLQIYNSVQTLCQLDSLYAIKTKAILLDQQTYMYNDQFGNKIKIKEEIDQTSKRQKDTIMAEYKNSQDLNQRRALLMRAQDVDKKIREKNLEDFYA